MHCVYCLLRDDDELTRAVVVFRGHSLCRAHLDTFMEEEKEQLKQAKRRETKPRTTTGTATSPGAAGTGLASGGTVKGLNIDYSVGDEGMTRAEARRHSDEMFRRLNTISTPIIPTDRSFVMDANAFSITHGRDDLPGPLAHGTIDSAGLFQFHTEVHE